MSIEIAIKDIETHFGISGVVGAMIIHYLKLAWDKYLPILVTGKEEQLIREALAGLKNPEDIAYFKATLAWVDAKIPNAGDNKYTLAATEVVKKFPKLAPFQDLLTNLLSQVGNAAKQGIDGGLAK